MPDDEKRDEEQAPNGTAEPNDGEDLAVYWAAVRGPRPERPLTPEEQAAKAFPGSLTIGTATNWLIRIHNDGTLEYGPEYTPDEAAVTFWEAMGRRRIQSEERFLQIAMMELHYALLQEADRAYETAQRRARREGATEHDRMMEEMSRRDLESRMHEIIEFSRELVAQRPDLAARVRRVEGPPPPEQQH